MEVACPFWPAVPAFQKPVLARRRLQGAHRLFLTPNDCPSTGPIRLLRLAHRFSAEHKESTCTANSPTLFATRVLQSRLFVAAACVLLH